MAVNEKKFTAIQGVAFLISLSGNKEGKVMEEAGTVNSYQSPFTHGITPQCRAQSKWQLSLGQGTQVGQWFQSFFQTEYCRNFSLVEKNICIPCNDQSFCLKTSGKVDIHELQKAVCCAFKWSIKNSKDNYSAQWSDMSFVLPAVPFWTGLRPQRRWSMYKIAITSFLPLTLPLTSVKTVGVYFHVRLKLGKDANQNKFEVA